MNLKKGTPGKGSGPRVETFSYCRVAHGLKNFFSAFIAGPTYWAEEAHEHTDRQPGTKPCLHWLTDGEVVCHRCRSSKPPTCIGWCPLYREIDHQPILVIVHESAAALLSAVSYPTHVNVGRVDATSSVVVRRSDTALSLATNNENRKRPVDITAQLVCMWNMPELDKWLQGRRATPQTTTDQPPVLRQRLSVPPPTTTTEALAIDAEKKAPSTWGQMVAESVNRAKGRAEKVERNGKHAPPKDE